MSKPIETNTEYLREILQAVYDLKNSAGGGSSKPDLVIGANLNDPINSPLYSMTADNLSIVSGSVDAVVEKVKQGLPVKVLLNTIHFYDSSDWYRNIAEANDVSLSCQTSSYPSDNYDHVNLFFFTRDCGGRIADPSAILIAINIKTGQMYYTHKSIKTE